MFYIHILSSWNAKEEEASTLYLSGMPKKKKTSTFYLPGMPKKKLPCSASTFCLSGMPKKKKLPHSIFLECQRRRSHHILSSWNAKEEKTSTFYLPGMPKKKLPCSTSTFCLPEMPKKKRPHSTFLECHRRSFHSLSSWNAYLTGMPKKKKLLHFTVSPQNLEFLMRNTNKSLH